MSIKQKKTWPLFTLRLKVLLDTGSGWIGGAPLMIRLWRAAPLFWFPQKHLWWDICGSDKHLTPQTCDYQMVFFSLSEFTFHHHIFTGSIFLPLQNFTVKPHFHLVLPSLARQTMCCFRHLRGEAHCLDKIVCNAHFKNSGWFTYA